MGSKQAWERTVALLLRLLSPSLPYADFAQAVRHLIASGQLVGAEPSGPYFQEPHAARPLLEKVNDLRAANVPLEAVTEAVDRMLHTHPQDTPALLEALAYIGVLPAEAWLQHVLGIEPRS